MAIHWYRPFWVLRPQKGPVFKPNDVQVKLPPHKLLPPKLPQGNSRQKLPPLKLWQWAWLGGGCPWLVRLGVLLFAFNIYTYIIFSFIEVGESMSFQTSSFALRYFLMWMARLSTHPLFSFVCLVVMLRASKQWCLLPCSWYHWKALDEYGCVKLVS
jgi:hypothetical protein